MTWDELRAEAFGEIGLNPTEFYDMERDDYWLLHEGFFNKRLHEYQLLRWAVSPIVGSWAKNFNPYVNMKLPNDDKLRKLLSELKKTENIVIEESALRTLKAFKDKEANQKSKEN